MSFTKRILKKERIVNNLDNILSLLKVDCLILDDWSSKFIGDLNPNDRKIRSEIINSFNGGCPNNHPNWKELTSISESLISISKNPNWVDIHFIQEKIGRIQLDESEMGSLEKISKKAIQACIKYFDK